MSTLTPDEIFKLAKPFFQCGGFDAFGFAEVVEAELRKRWSVQVVSPVCPHPCRYAHSIDHTQIAGPKEGS